MIFIFIAILLFLAGFIISTRGKGGYLISAIASIFSFLGGVSGLKQSYNLFYIHLVDNINLIGKVDHLTSIFLIFASISWFAISIFSVNYGRNHGKSSESIINLIFLGMLLVLIAHDGITFLSGWELMTIFSFLMILAEKEVKYRNAFSFLAFGELSSVLIIIGFASLYLSTDSISFASIKYSKPLFLILTTIGFFIKMDIVPFHTWMKNVYDKAPTNVCAILSAPMTLMGVYGIIRVVKIYNIPLNEFYVVLLALGGLSAFWGALQAVATGGLKILPAYSTVENNGLILSAISFSFLTKDHYLANFAFAAGLIVAFGHLLAKSLLFISIGHAKEAYGAHIIDEVRGVWKGVGKIPAIGILVAGLSLSAFPPLIGYVGEWMILESIFQSFKFAGNFYRFFGTFIGVLIALGIGLTGFAMVKLIGYTSLGYHHNIKIKELKQTLMKFSEIFLIIFVIGAGIFAPVLFKMFGYSYMLGGVLGVPKPFLIMSGKPIFGVISPTFLFIVIGVLFLAPFSIYAMTKRKVRKVNSFNGALPLKEEEYFTAHAFSYILEHILEKVYRTKEKIIGGNYIIEVSDILTYPYGFFKRLSLYFGKLTARVLMNGKIYWYIIYILAIFLLCFFIAK